MKHTITIKIETNIEDESESYNQVIEEISFNISEMIETHHKPHVKNFEIVDYW